MWVGLSILARRCDLSHDFLDMAKDGVPMVPHAIDYFLFTPGACTNGDIAHLPHQSQHQWRQQC